MMKISTMVFEAVDPIPASDRFMAFLVQGTYSQTSLLPVYFRSETADGARIRAITFWDDEKARARAMAERGKKLGLARRRTLPSGDPD
jgi:hypothetical protein